MFFATLNIKKPMMSLMIAKEALMMAQRVMICAECVKLRLQSTFFLLTLLILLLIIGLSHLLVILDNFGIFHILCSFHIRCSFYRLSCFNSFVGGYFFFLILFRRCYLFIIVLSLWLLFLLYWGSSLFRILMRLVVLLLI